MIGKVEQDDVNAALQCAIEAEHSFDGWSDEDIALDMIAYDAFAEHLIVPPTEELITMVRVWRAAQEETATL